MAQFRLDDGKERRQQQRVQARFIVTYRPHKPLEVSFFIAQRQVQALMLDLSPVGMALLTSYNLPAATLLQINFTLINTKASQESSKVKMIDLAGEVRYARPAGAKEYRLGIRFVQVNKEDSDSLLEFVEAASQG